MVEGIEGSSENQQSQWYFQSSQHHKKISRNVWRRYATGCHAYPEIAGASILEKDTKGWEENGQHKNADVIHTTHACLK